MIRWEKKIQTLLALALVCSLALCLLPTAAGAAGVDLDQTGKIRLDISLGDEDEGLKDGITVTVDVYQVATVNAAGRFTATRNFQALAEELAALSGDTSMSGLTEKVLAVLLPETETETAEGEEPEEPVPAFDPDFTAEKLSVPGGEIAFDSLGLYLIVPREAAAGDYVFSFLPVLLPVPASGPEVKDDGSEGDYTWLYEYTVYMKATRDDRTGELEIEKQLLRYNETLGKVKFSFEVTAVKDGETVYSDIVTLSFEGPGIAKALVKDLPVGSVVTVREVYSGGAYLPASAASFTVTIEPSDEEQEVLKVTFVNDYNERLVPSIGVVNEFTQSGIGWRWNQVEDNSVEQGGEAG